MFLAYCPRHGSDVLLGYRTIRSLVNVAPGVIVLEAACYDGAVVHIITGARAAEFRRVPGADSTKTQAADEHRSAEPTVGADATSDGTTTVPSTTSEPADSTVRSCEPADTTMRSCEPAGTAMPSREPSDNTVQAS